MNNTAKSKQEYAPDSYGWVGVDLDGTLAMYHGFKGYEDIGEPIPAMMARVKSWIAAGIDVRIFTARASDGPIATRPIARWLKRQGLPALRITNVKDADCVEVWDDRAVTVVSNTGEPAGGAGETSRIAELLLRQSTVVWRGYDNEGDED